jgi:2-polyprenyl-3-methyl-5-hydroxy-6-metoxy-1,4-benzoquinol methylase
MIQWDEGGDQRSAHWHSENGIRAHQKVVLGDDTLTADIAYRLACEGTAILYRGDFQNARQLLQALIRRVDKAPKKSKRVDRVEKVKKQSPLDTFNLHRLAQSQRARILGMLLIEVNTDHSISLRRAPDVTQACLEAYGEQNEPYVISLRELLGVISAHEWRKKGVPVLVRDDEEIRIHPHYGVFSPIRGEYIVLVLKAPLPVALQKNSIAFDIGTGTGVLSLMLAKQFPDAKITAIELDAAAASQAADNFAHSTWAANMQVIQTDFETYSGANTYDLIISNPPFFTASLPSEDIAKNRARHAPANLLANWIEKSSQLLIKS